MASNRRGQRTHAGPPISLIILDCDGVLVDSEPISTRELTRAINDVGLSMTYEEVSLNFKGETLPAIAGEVESRLGAPLPAAWLDEFQSARAGAFEAELQPVPGVAAAIRALRDRGFDLCVASQASLTKTNLTLGLTGLAEHLGDAPLFSASMVRRPKPAPDLFLHAAAQCGHSPGDCLVVEDGVLGVRAARAAEMRVLGYSAGGDGDRLEAAGAQLFHRMSELPERILSSETELRSQQ